MAKKVTERTRVKRPAQSRKQSFCIHAPTARTVLLAGDFTDWQQGAIPMEKHRDGSWHAEMSLPPGAYHYRYLVDGQWQDDPACSQRVANAFGTQDCVRQVG